MKTIMEMSLRNIIPNKFLSSFIDNINTQEILDILHFYEKQKKNLTNDHFRKIIQDIIPKWNSSEKAMKIYSEQVLDKLEEVQKRQGKKDIEHITPTNKKDIEHITPTNKKDLEHITPTNKKDILQVIISEKNIDNISISKNNPITQPSSPKEEIIKKVVKKVQKRKKIWTEEDDERESKRVYHKNEENNVNQVKNTLYKTKMCNWSHNCLHRDCQYAHAEEEVRCFHFNTTGKCRFGDYCSRVHDTI